MKRVFFYARARLSSLLASRSWAAHNWLDSLNISTSTLSLNIIPIFWDCNYLRVGLCCFVGVRRTKQLTGGVSAWGITERKSGGCSKRLDIIYKSKPQRPKKLFAFMPRDASEATNYLFLTETITERKSRRSFQSAKSAAYEKQLVALNIWLSPYC